MVDRNETTNDEWKDNDVDGCKIDFLNRSISTLTSFSPTLIHTLWMDIKIFDSSIKWIRWRSSSINQRNGAGESLIVSRFWAEWREKSAVERIVKVLIIYFLVKNHFPLDLSARVCAVVARLVASRVQARIYRKEKDTQKRKRVKMEMKTRMEMVFN